MEHAADPDLVRDARRGDEAALTSLHPGLHSKNLLTILNGREVELSGRHARSAKTATERRGHGFESAWVGRSLYNANQSLTGCRRHNHHLKPP